MDRHDLPGASAENVAEAHARDLEVQETYGVSFLSYWFDEESGAAFCLARAPTADEMETVHRESHGLVPNEIIPVSEDAVLQFLGKVHDPVDGSEPTSAFRTILFTDLEGSTALADSLEPAEFIRLLGEHDLSSGVRSSQLADARSSTRATGSWPRSTTSPARSSAPWRSGTGSTLETSERRPRSAFVSDWQPGSRWIATATSSDRR